MGDALNLPHEVAENGIVAETNSFGNEALIANRTAVPKVPHRNEGMVISNYFGFTIEIPGIQSGFVIVMLATFQTLTSRSGAVLDYSCGLFLCLEGKHVHMINVSSML